MDIDYYKRLSGRNFFTRRYTERKHEERLSYLKSTIKDNKLSVLDVGCAEGFFGKKLIDELGWKTDGVEISLDRLIAEKNLNRVYSNLNDVETKYDLILCFHVLEHISDDTILDDFHRLLNCDGRLVVEVPNKSGHRYIEFDKNHEHVRFFDQSSIVELLSTHGFTITKYQIGCFESPAYNDSIRIECVKTSDHYQYSDYFTLFERIKNRKIIVYGTGGDYTNYIQPISTQFDIVGYYNDDGDKTISLDDMKKYNSDGIIVLICSIKYEEKMLEHLNEIGWDMKNVITLGDILCV